MRMDEVLRNSIVSCGAVVVAASQDPDGLHQRAQDGKPPPYSFRHIPDFQKD